MLSPSAAHLPQHRAIKAGEYLFARRPALPSVVEEIEAGRVVIHHLTVPEGLTSAQIVQIITAEPALNGEIATQAEAVCCRKPITSRLAIPAPRWSKEMQKAAKQALAVAWANRDPQTLLKSPHEALVLASIVEKEPACRPSGLWWRRYSSIG